MTGSENFAAGVTAYRNLAWSSWRHVDFDGPWISANVITITPQSGHNITSWNFLVKHNQPGLANGYSTGWLDMRLCTPTSLLRTFSGSAGQVWHRMIEKWSRSAPHGDERLYMFCNCSSLQSVTLDTGAVTSAHQMFTAVHRSIGHAGHRRSGRRLPDVQRLFIVQSVTLDTGAVVDAFQMFFVCSSLQSVVLDTGAVTNASQMFYGCSSLPIGDPDRTHPWCQRCQRLPPGCARRPLHESRHGGRRAQTITVSGNYGTTGDDPSIATGKGWTISGS